ncbi:MAG TPA: PH domain-containing protein [Xanthomonadales bacterium]|nr:PH domain-containing protein [Xanthomonadales bacterium]
MSSSKEDYDPGSDPGSHAPARRLHPFSWLFVLLTQLRPVAVPLLLLLFFKRGDGWELYGAIGAAVIALYSLVYSWSFRYRLGDGELLVREGLLARTERHIPYARIQNIVQKRNPLHRLFGVTELRLESAGGRKPEAVMNVITLADAQRLERVLRSGHAGEIAAADEHPPSDTLLTLPLRDVLLLGLLGNRGMIVIGAFMGSAWQFEWWERDRMRDMFRVPSHMLHELAEPAHLLGWAWTIVLLAAGFFVLLKLFSMAVSLTSFYGFRLARDGDRIATESGLLTRHGASARVDKIQRLTVGESWLARFAGRRWLSCDVAAGARTGDHDSADQKRLKWLAPIAAHERIEKLATSLDPALSLDAMEWQPLHARAARRRFKPSLFLYTLGTIPAWWWLGTTTAVAAWVVLVALAWFEARGWARFAAWACDGRVLAFRAGWLTRHWTIARIAKGQVASVSVTPFDRRHGMAKVQLDTAGAGLNDFRLDVPYLDEREARRLAARLRAAME